MVSDKPPDDLAERFDDDLDDVDDDDTDPKARGFASKMIGDLARRAITTGIGAVFMSEEALRGQLSDMKLPKEAMHAVAAQADKTKREIVAVVARETREFLSKLEVDKVLARALVGATIEVQTKIRILPKEGGGVATEIESSEVAVDRPEKPKRARKKKRDEADEE